jgi:hypothetical protein
MTGNRISEIDVDLTEALRIQLDKQKLYELLLNYCRGVDRHDFALLHTLYHPDSTDDHSPLFKGSGPEYVRWIPNILERYAITSHVITGAFFNVDGDVAEGEAHVTAYHLTKKEPAREVIFHGRFLDRYERRQGVWRILERVTVNDWFESRIHDKDLAARLSRDILPGRSDENDPLYSRLKLVKRGIR